MSRDSWNDPKRVEGLDNLDHVNVCAAFASGVISAAIGDDGSVWSWGSLSVGSLVLGRVSLRLSFLAKLKNLQEKR